MAEARIPQIGHTPEINRGAWHDCGLRPTVQRAADRAFHRAAAGNRLGNVARRPVWPRVVVPIAGRISPAFALSSFMPRMNGARRFCERFAFLPFTDQPPTLYRLVKDLRRRLSDRTEADPTPRPWQAAPDPD